MARGKTREDAILTAALELLREEGYEAMTMDGLAARARASKATIYRRWTSKARVVKAALDAVDADQAASAPETGALRSDLVAVMRSLREKANQPYVEVMTELVTAARRDPELAALLDDHVADDELSPFRDVLRRAVRRRELSRTVDDELVHDIAEAMILRQLQLRLPFDEAFIDRVVDRILLPLMRRKRSRA